MCYFHIGELIPETLGIKSREEYEAYFKEPGTLKARYIRHLKSNLGKKGAWNKMERLVRLGQFSNLQEADKMIDWGNVPVVKL